MARPYKVFVVLFDDLNSEPGERRGTVIDEKIEEVVKGSQEFWAYVLRLRELRRKLEAHNERRAAAAAARAAAGKPEEAEEGDESDNVVTQQEREEVERLVEQLKQLAAEEGPEQAAAAAAVAEAQGGEAGPSAAAAAAAEGAEAKPEGEAEEEEGAEEGAEEEEEGDTVTRHQPALAAYARLVRQALSALAQQPEFAHVTFARQAQPLPGQDLRLGIKIGDVLLTKVDRLEHPLDLLGVLTGRAVVPPALEEVLQFDEEAGLTVTDEALDRAVARIAQRAGLAGMYDAFAAGEHGEAFSQALDTLVAEADGAEDGGDIIDPYDALRLLVVHLAKLTGLSPVPNPIAAAVGFGRGLLSRVLHPPRRLLSGILKRTVHAERAWWGLEEGVVGVAKLAVRVARKAVRPVLIALIVRNVLQTLESSQDPLLRVTRLPQAEQHDNYWRLMLGDDYEQQIQECLEDAVRDVDAGYITDDINHEKRLMSAAALRRLEIEDWDKERMKNFYLSTFGQLPWHAAMEEALHNPLFITARGWTGPIENWVGKNQAFHNDIDPSPLSAEAALQVAEAAVGRRLSPYQRARVLSRIAARAAQTLPHSQAFKGVLTPESVRKIVEQPQQQ